MKVKKFILGFVLGFWYWVKIIFVGLWEMKKTILGLLLVIAAVVLGFWLSLRVLLYGGIMQAVNNWGVDNPAVVWGIIKAFFFEFGFIPAYILGAIGVSCFE